jgi:hypothetical protein
MFDSDRQIDRRVDKGQGPVKHDNKTENFFHILFEDDELRAAADGQCPWAITTCEREREPETMTTRLSDRVDSKLN